MSRGSARGLGPSPQERGASAVEFGLIAPVLVLLVFGIMSFGILFAQTLALNNAARQGARFGAVGDRTCSQLIDETRAAASSISMSPADVDIVVKRGTSLASATTGNAGCATGSNLPCIGSTAGDNVYVQATYDSQLLIPLFVTDSSFTVGGTGAFRCEYSS